MKAQQMPAHTTNQVSVHPLQEGDLGEADLIFRLAFGTFLGLPEPLSFMGDADPVRTRWHADPGASLAAEVDGQLVGSSFAAWRGRTSWATTVRTSTLSMTGDEAERSDVWTLPYIDARNGW